MKNDKTTEKIIGGNEMSESTKLTLAVVDRITTEIATKYNFQKMPYNNDGGQSSAMCTEISDSRYIIRVRTPEKDKYEVLKQFIETQIENFNYIIEKVEFKEKNGFIMIREFVLSSKDLVGNKNNPHFINGNTIIVNDSKTINNGATIIINDSKIKSSVIGGGTIDVDKTTEIDTDISVVTNNNKKACPFCDFIKKIFIKRGKN